MKVSSIGPSNLYSAYNAHQGIKAKQLSQDPSLVSNSKGSNGWLTIDDFQETFDVDHNGQLDNSEIKRLGDFANDLSKKIGAEVHIGVSRTKDGTLRASITSGGADQVKAAYPEGTPVFSGHTHLNGTSGASSMDISSRLTSGTNVVWDAVNGKTGYY